MGGTLFTALRCLGKGWNTNLVNKPEENNFLLMMSAQITDAHNVNNVSVIMGSGLDSGFLCVNAPVVSLACIDVSTLHDYKDINAHRTELTYVTSETSSVPFF